MILSGPQQQVGKARHAAAEDVVLQSRRAVGAAELDGEILFGQDKACLAVELDAAVYAEAVISPVEGKRAGQLIELGTGVIDTGEGVLVL